MTLSFDVEFFSKTSVINLIPVKEQGSSSIEMEFDPLGKYRVTYR